MKKQKINNENIKSGCVPDKCANIFCNNNVGGGVCTLIQFGTKVTILVCRPCEEKIKDFFGVTI